MTIMCRGKDLVQICLECIFIDVNIPLKICLDGCELSEDVEGRVEVIGRRSL